MSIVLAYDGSIANDWIARYAIHLAMADDRVVHAVHVSDGVPTSETRARLESLGAEAVALQVDWQVHVVARRDSVARSIERAMPDPSAVLVCGLRARESGRGLLRGTVSAALLERRRRDVMALRVVSPGVLGAPRRALYALSENPRAVGDAIPFLRRLTPMLDELHLLTVMAVHPLQFPTLSRTARTRLVERGRASLLRARTTLGEELSPPLPTLDPDVVVSDAIAPTIAVHAGRIRAQLVVVGASDRSFPERMVAGHPLEDLLHRAPCDIAVIRRARRS